MSFFIDDPTEAGRRRRRFRSSFRNNKASPRLRRKPIYFRAFLLKLIGAPPPKPRPLKKHFTVDEIRRMFQEARSDSPENFARIFSSSTPAARIYLLANMGRLRAAAEAGNTYTKGPVWNRFPDPRAIDALAHVHIELGDLESAEQFIPVPDQAFWTGNPSLKSMEAPGRREPSAPRGSV